LDKDHVEKVLAVIHQNRHLTVRKVAEEVGICEGLCQRILTKKLKMCCVATKFVPHLLVRHSLSMNFLRSMRQLLSPSRPTLQIWPLRTFLVPKVEILTKRSPISDGRGDRRKFDMGPLCCPAKHIPGRVPGMEQTLGVVYQEWKGALCRRQVSLSCK